MYPFEVADGYAACVTDHVRHHKDTTAGQNIISIRIGRAVSPFQHQLTRQGFRALTSYLAFKRRRDQNIHLQTPERIAGDSFRARETGNLFVFCLPCRERFHVNTGGVKQRRGMILNRHDTGASACKQTRGFAADVTKTLNRNASAFNGDIRPTRGFQPADENAAPRRFFTTQRTAKMDRLTGDDASDRRAMIHGIRIHHPGHHFTVGADIRRRNIFLRPDDNADLAGIAAGQTLQFTFRQRERIDADAAFGAAVRQIQRGTFDGHPC